MPTFYQALTTIKSLLQPATVLAVQWYLIKIYYRTAISSHQLHMNLSVCAIKYFWNVFKRQTPYKRNQFVSETICRLPNNNPKLILALSRNSPADGQYKFLWFIWGLHKQFITKDWSRGLNLLKNATTPSKRRFNFKPYTEGEWADGGGHFLRIFEKMRQQQLLAKVNVRVYVAVFIGQCQKCNV